MRDIRSFKTKAFREGAIAALKKEGFVTDEHPFAPYRDVVSRKVEEIQEYLREHGATYELGAGELETPAFGPVFFIYDKNRLSPAQAFERVGQWARQAVDCADEA